MKAWTALLTALFLVASLSLFRPEPVFSDRVQDNRLILHMNSKSLSWNGKPFLATQPLTVNQGVSYVSLETIAQIYGYSLAYLNGRNDAVASLGKTVIRFKAGNRAYTVNGASTIGQGAVYRLNGTTMIPLRAWTQATSSALNLKGTQIELQWQTSLKADSPAEKMLPLAISANGRYLVKADGSPFFWLGDTAWELLHRLNRDEAYQYLKNAADNGFTVIQAVGISELSGGTGHNVYGDEAVWSSNPANPNEDYWKNADYIIDTAESLGLYVALLPAWGSYLWSNVGQPSNIMFDETSAKAYGWWLGSRYKDMPNLIWVLGGDRIPDSPDKVEIVRSLARGLVESGAEQLKTFHPWGQKSSSEWFQNDDWLDFNMIQSGHSAKNYPNDALVDKDYAKTPVKPTLDAEARYERMPVLFKPENEKFNAYDVRQAAYWALMAGAFGHTYGNNSIWQMFAPGRQGLIGANLYWQDALKSEGRTQMKYVRQLMESRPLQERVPDQTLIADGPRGDENVRASRGKSYAFAYSPKGAHFTVNMGKITGDRAIARWYNPRTGESTLEGSFANSGTRTFSPPSEGSDQDWILMLDDAAENFQAP